MVENMLELASQLLKEHAGLTPNQQLSQACVGFVLPPFNEVPYLHTHCVAPKQQMKLWARLKFWGNFWFRDARSVVQQLQGQQVATITI
ncbi:unnamed protein product [Chrysoparadoxa australica]